MLLRAVRAGLQPQVHACSLHQRQQARYALRSSPRLPTRSPQLVRRLDQRYWMNFCLHTRAVMRLRAASDRACKPSVHNTRGQPVCARQWYRTLLRSVVCHNG
jgi:hypothetical protein